MNELSAALKRRFNYIHIPVVSDQKTEVEIVRTRSAELLERLWEHLYQKRMSSWIDRQVVVQARPGLADLIRSIHLKVMADVDTATPPPQSTTISTRTRDAVLVECRDLQTDDDFADAEATV